MFKMGSMKSDSTHFLLVSPSCEVLASKSVVGRWRVDWQHALVGLRKVVVNL